MTMPLRDRIRLHDNRGVCGFPGAHFEEDGPRALELYCDILIPAAMESQITQGNAARVKARVIAEGANGPVTFAANEILRQRGVTILPDVYLNAGGVMVSYFEWVKNVSHMRFGRLDRRIEEKRGRELVHLIEEMVRGPVPEHLAQPLLTGSGEIDHVRSGLDDSMCLAYNEIRERFLSRNDIPDLHTAAFMIAIEKVARAYQELELH